jgi:hypothetical protein
MNFFRSKLIQGRGEIKGKPVYGGSKSVYGKTKGKSFFGLMDNC